MIGINLSGAEFGTGNRYGFDYFYPTQSDLQYYHDKGMTFVRLPVKWERLQPTLGGAIDQAELARLNTFLDQANKLGMKVLLDVHNYGWYNGKAIGTSDVPISSFADFWGKLAGQLKDNPAIAGYGLMNEPHDLPDATVWPAAAQAATDAIRKVDMTHDIYVAGDGWSSAGNWSWVNTNLDVKDPANKLVYEAHLYFDKDNSGTHYGTVAQDGMGLETGAYRLGNFVDWLKAHNARGFIGEFAVPDSDPQWNVVLNNALKYMADNNLSGTYWGGGSAWGDYPFSPRNADGSDSAQMAVLSAAVNGQTWDPNAQTATTTPAVTATLPDGFVALQYAASNPDLIAQFGANEAALTNHYLTKGAAEGRPTATFDPLLYGASYADLIQVFGSNTFALLRHYIDYGYHEGRKISFDAMEYAASNPDLIATVGTDPDALAKQYIDSGYAAHRSLNSFDPAAYAAANPDVVALVGSDAHALEQHYVLHGYAEGRATAPVAHAADGSGGTGDTGATTPAPDVSNPAPTNHATRAHAAPDFDGSGRSDILWVNRDGAMSSWQSAGGTTTGFTKNAAWISGVDKAWTVAATADMDGDGVSDLVWHNAQSGGIAVWKGSGAGQFIQSSFLSTGVASNWSVVGSGDFNGDGKDDILWRSTNGAVSTWSSTGTGYTANTMFANVDPSWHIQGLGDFNGDGRTDIVWRHKDGAVSLWLGKTDGSFQSTGASDSAATSWHIAAVGDFDGDGKSDLLWRADNGDVSVWTANSDGSAGFTHNSFYASSPGSDWTIQGTGDFNGDGAADVLWHNSDGRMSVWEGAGHGFKTGTYNDFAATDWSMLTPHFDMI